MKLIPNEDGRSHTIEYENTTDEFRDAYCEGAKYDAVVAKQTVASTAICEMLEDTELLRVAFDLTEEQADEFARWTRDEFGLDGFNYRIREIIVKVWNERDRDICPDSGFEARACDLPEEYDDIPKSAGACAE